MKMFGRLIDSRHILSVACGKDEKDHYLLFTFYQDITPTDSLQQEIVIERPNPDGVYYTVTEIDEESCRRLINS